MDLFKPSSYLIWSVHLDGQEEIHDKNVNHKGVVKDAFFLLKIILLFSKK